MDTMLHVGASENASEAVGKVIVEILKSDVDQMTIQIALNVLQEASSVSNVTIEGCSFVDHVTNLPDGAIPLFEATPIPKGDQT